MHYSDAPPHLLFSRKWSDRKVGLFKSELFKQFVHVTRPKPRDRALSLALKGLRAVGAAPFQQRTVCSLPCSHPAVASSR